MTIIRICILYYIYLFILTINLCSHFSVSLLFPQQNEFRQINTLDGLWTFVAEPSNSIGIGFINSWHRIDLSRFSNSTVMPVPSAYNDITMSQELRDHVGWVWYQTTYYLHNDMLPKCTLTNSFMSNCQLRVSSKIYFESVNYFARVFINGHEVVMHEGGHLPFEAPIFPSMIDFDNPARILITVAVNNTLSSMTIPPGEVYVHLNDDGKVITRQSPNFDFFHYSGILRSVNIVHLPINHITTAKLGTTINKKNEGILTYTLNGTNIMSMRKYFFQISLYERWSEKLIHTSNIYKPNGVITLKSVAKWWPRGYGRPYLYNVEIKYVMLIEAIPILLDIYRDSIGFRTISFDNTSIYINFKRFYCIGFGMHEESAIRGRGFDRVFMTKDLNMLEWLGGNCYRTSHYPYSEERAREADRRGIAVIAEAPAVGLKDFSDINCQLHAKMIKEMIERDQNRPSVFMWSIANEPASYKKTSSAYFSELSLKVRELDATRPVTAVLNADSEQDHAARWLDIIGINRYYGWYSNLGDLSIINESLTMDLLNWQKKFQKPIFLAEYGAEAILGLSEDPVRPFSEQYQLQLMNQTHIAFDLMRDIGLLSGEMIWNFADFMTDVSRERVAGNHKGVLTRDRKPKASAYAIQQRYMTIFNQFKKQNQNHDEL